MSRELSLTEYCELAKGFGFQVWGFSFRVSDFGFRFWVRGFEVRALGSEFIVWGSGIRKLELRVARRLTEIGKRCSKTAHV